MQWEEVLSYVQAYELLQASDLEHFMIHGHDSGSRVPMTMLGAAVHCYTSNPNPLDLVVQLLDRLTPTSAHTVIARADGNGSTALMDACRLVPSSFQLMQTLLLIGATTTINVSDDTGASALMIAARNSFTSGVQLLLQRSADISQVDALGHTALWHSCNEHAPGPAIALVLADASIRGSEVLSCACAVLPQASMLFLALLMAGVTLGGLSAVLTTKRWLYHAECKHRDHPELATNESVHLPAPPFLFMRLRARPHLLLLTMVPGGSLLIFVRHNAASYPVCFHGLFYLASILLIAAFYPELSFAGQTERQQAHTMLVVRIGTIFWSTHSVAVVLNSRFNAIGFEPQPGKDPLLLTLAIMSGHAPLKLSSWMSLCSTFHSMVILLLVIPVLFLGLQPTQWVRKRFPPWSVVRLICFMSGLNDLLLLSCTGFFLWLAPAAGTPPSLDSIQARTLFYRILTMAPVPLFLSGLTTDLRHEISRWLKSPLSKLELPALFGETAAAKAAADRDADFLLCVVCLDELRSQILAPCGHRCVCTECAPSLVACPICRARVKCVISQVWDS